MALRQRRFAVVRAAQCTSRPHRKNISQSITVSADFWRRRAHFDRIMLSLKG
jgi:hypothetical protein